MEGVEEDNHEVEVLTPKQTTEVITQLLGSVQ